MGKITPKKLRLYFKTDGSYIEKDIIRENEIKEFLGCKFIRIKD